MSKDPGYRQNVYKALKAKVGGFDKSEEEFNNALNDPNYQKNVYKALKAKVGGFDKSEEEFKSLVSGSSIKKKSTTVSPSEQNQEDVSLGTSTMEVKKPLVSSGSEDKGFRGDVKKKEFYGDAGAGKKSYILDETSGIPVWKEFSNVLDESNRPVYGKTITDPVRVKTLNKFFKQGASTSEVDKIYTGFPGQEDNQYREYNGSWQRMQPTAKSWTTVNEPNAVAALNKQFNKDIKPIKGLNVVKEGAKFTDINTKLVSQTEGNVVPYLQKKYSKLGFTFEEAGIGQDFVTVTAKDGKTKIDVSLDEANPEEALKLRHFLSQNASTPESKKSIYLKAKREEDPNYSKTPEYINALKSLSPDEVEDLIDERKEVLSKKLSETSRDFDLGGYKKAKEDLDSLYSSEEYKIYKEKKSEKQKERATKVDQLYYELNNAKTTKDKQYIKSKINTFLSDDIIQKQTDGYNMQLMDVQNAYKKINSEYTNLNSAAASGKLTQEQYDAQLAKLNQKRVDLKENSDGVISQMKKLEKVTGKYLLDKEKMGSFGGNLLNAFVTGISKMVETPAAGSVESSKTQTYEALSPEEKKYLSDKGYSREQAINYVANKNAKKIKEEIRGGAVEFMGARGTTKEYSQSKDRGFFESTLAGVAESLPSMIIPGGALARTAAMSSQAYASIEDEMLNDEDFETTSMADRSLVAMPYAVGMGLLENLGFTKMISKDPLAKSLVMKSITKVMTKKGTTETLESALEKELKSNITKYGLKVVGGTLAEAETGALQSALLDVGLKTVYNKIRNYREEATDEEIAKLTNQGYFNTPDNLSEASIQVLKDAAAEGIGGKVMTSAMTGFEMLSNGEITLFNDDDITKLKELSSDPEMKKMFVAKLRTDMVNGDITKEQAKTKLEALRSVESDFNRIPDDITGADLKRAVELSIEKKDLTNEIAGKDEALVAPKKARIEEINNELKTIGENATKESSAIPSEISDLKDDEEVSLTVGTIDEVPEEFRDRAIKNGGRDYEVRKIILGLPIGKKQNIKTEESYTYKLTGKEAKDYAIKESNKQENGTESDIVQREGVNVGQQEVGQGEGSQRETAQPSADTSDSNIGSQEEKVDPLINVEATAKALNNDLAQQIQDESGQLFPLNVDEDPAYFTRLSERYHEAKQNGTEPELVNAFENVLGKNQQPVSEVTTEEATQPTIDKEVEAIGEFITGSNAEIDQKVSRIKNKRIARSVSRAAKALSNVLPDVKIMVHETNDAYSKATGENAGISNGQFDPKTNTIHINSVNANARTVAHEVFHAVLLNKVKTDVNAQDITKKLVDAIAPKIDKNPALKKYLDDFSSQYENNIQNEEKLAEFIGKLAENYNSFTTPIKDIITRWINKLADMFGLERTNDTYDALKTIAGKIASGKEITESDVDIIPNGDSEVGEFNIPRLSKVKKAPKASDDERQFIRDLVEDIDIREFNGNKFVTNMYDYTNAGVTDLGNGFKINLFGGKNYVPYMMSLKGKKIGEVSNLAAFNTKAQAETFIRNAKKSGAKLFAPHSGTLGQSWQFQQHTFAELVNLILDNDIMTNDQLIDSFNKVILGSDAAKNNFKAFSKNYGEQIRNFDVFKSDPKKIIELLDIKNNFSPDLRKILNNSISSNKIFQKAIGINNKQEFYNKIIDPLNNGVKGGEIMNVVKFDPNTFEIVETKADNIDHHPSFGWTLLAKIDGIYQPTEFHFSSDVTNEYTKYNIKKEVVSKKSEEPEFNKKNVSSSAGAIPKVANFENVPKEKVTTRNQKTINEKLKEELSDKEINTLRKSLRLKFKDSYIIDVLDSLQNAKKNDTVGAFEEVDYLLENGVNLNYIANTLVEEGNFDSKKGAISYFTSIGEGIGLNDFLSREQLNIDDTIKKLKDQGFTDAAIKKYLENQGIKGSQSQEAIRRYNAVKDNVFLNDPKTGLPKIAQSIKKWSNDQLTTKGNRPNSMFEAQEDMEGVIAKSLNKVVRISKDFNKVYNAIPKDLREEFLENYDSYLRGNKKADISEDAKIVANEMRNQIDALSRNIINAGIAPLKVAKEIQENLGSYLTRSYEVFKNKDYKAKEEIVQRAKNFLNKKYLNEAKRIANAKGTEVDFELNRLVNNKIDQYTNKISADDFVGGGKLGSKSKELGVFKERTKIPIEIRQLMGEFTDPVQNYAETVMKLSALSAKNDFLNKIKDAGMGVYLFTEKTRPEGYNVMIAAPGSDAMNPLNGLYTTPEIAKEFNNLPGELGKLMKIYMKAISMIKWGKTIGSVMTHAKNLFGNLGFVAVNGHTSGAVDAFKAIYSDISNSSNEEIRKRIDKYIELGIMKQSAGIGEIRDMFKDADFDKSLAERLSKRPSIKKKPIASVLGRGKRIAKSIGSAAETAYQAEDDFFKVLAYESELRRYAKAEFNKDVKDLTDSERSKIDKTVANIVKDTMPTFSRIPKIVKNLRKSPLLGNFISFQAESYRTAFKTMQLAKSEITSKNPAIRAIGARRVIGTLTYLSAKNALLSFYGSAFGMGLAGLAGYFGDDDDEKEKEKDLRKFLPPWSTQSDIIPIKNSDGTITYIDMSASDPHGGIGKAFNAFFGGDNPIDGAKEAMFSIFKPFLEPEMTAKAMFNLVSGTDNYDRPIWNSEDDWNGIAGNIAEFAFGVAQPGTVTSALRISNSEDKLKEVIGASTGYRPIKIDVGESFGYRVYDYRDRLDKAKELYSSISRNEKATDEEKEKALEKANSKTEEIYKQLMEDYNSAERLGVDSGKLRTELKDKLNLSDKNLKIILSGGYAEVKPKEAERRKIIFR
jgi:hypothetical protein